MPIFAYQCRACGHQFDALQKLNAAPLSACPECDAPRLRKLLSAPNVHRGASRTPAKDAAQGPKKRPKIMHALDSPRPHAEHHAHSHDHGHGHSHDKNSKNKHDH